MSELVLLALAILVCSAMTAFFSGSETGAISANRHRLRNMQKSGDERAEDTIVLLSDSQKILTITLVGTNIFSILGVLFAKNFFEIILESLNVHEAEGIADIVSLLTMTPFLLIAGEIIPKRLFRKYPDQLMLVFRKPLKFFSIIFMPAVSFFNSITYILLRPLGIKKGITQSNLTREDLQNLVESVEPAPSHGHRMPAPNGEADMIQSIINLEKTLVREIMKPLVDIIAIPIHAATRETIIDTALRTGYTRIPVYTNYIFNMVGYIDVYDILRGDATAWKDLKSEIKDACYVPETKRIDDLLQEMLGKHISVAFAIDEYGGCSGFVTLEDILEEIVGEIDDEFDKSTFTFSEQKPGVYIVDPRMDLDDLNEKIGISLPKRHCETLGGFIYSTLGRVPQVNESFIFGDYRITITEMKTPKIIRVQIEQIKTKPDIDGQRE